MDKFHIKKISEIDTKKLLQFYQVSFQYEKSILDNYQWRYRSEFNEFEPNKEAPLPADEGLEGVFPRWSDWVLLEDNRDRALRLFIEPLMRLTLLHNL